MQRINGKHVVSGMWLKGAAALWVAALLVGCQGVEEGGDDTQECFSVQLYGRNPATGACELAPVTCPQRVPGSSDWQLPEGWAACDDVPPINNTCAGLDEYTCYATPGCEPLYSREDGSNARPGSTEPATDLPAGAPVDGDQRAPYPYPMPEDGYAFAGCYEQHVQACEGLDEGTCYATPGCTPVYEGVPCTCAGTSSDPATGAAEYVPPEDCACPAIAQYARCENNVEPPPPSCYDLYDANACYSIPGCRWVYSNDTTTPSDGADKICFCEDPSSPDCVCGGVPMPPQDGYCEPDVVVNPCNYFNPDECSMDSNCEWIGEGGFQDPMPCDCAPGEDCACGGGAMPEPWGYCQVRSTKPDNCYDVADEYSCYSIPGCEWIYMRDEAPPDCICLEGDPNCGCGGMPYPVGYCQPMTTYGCWDYYDEYSCGSDPSCMWFSDGTDGGSDIAPCECAPDDANCACTMPVPAPGGYCGDRYVEPQGCVSYYDEYTCISDPTCAWQALDDGMQCDCDPAYPDCACFAPPMSGYCYDAPQNECDFQGDEYSCISTPGCAWTPEGGEAPPDTEPCICPDGSPDCQECTSGLIDPCWGAWLDESGLCRGAADEALPDECCYQVEPPPPPGRCHVAVANCGDLFDERSCFGVEGCTWLTEGSRPIAPPICDDPADPNCGVSYCEGAQLDAAGACVLPDGQIAPECCETTTAGVCVAN